jgi:uncharacterized protein YoxC
MAFIRIPIHIPELEIIMAKIDDVAAQVQTLTTAVRDFMGRESQIIQDLNSELETLRADDAIENEKLEGISGVVQTLTDEVNNFGQSTEVPVDPTEPDSGTEPISEEPLVPTQLPADESNQ